MDSNICPAAAVVLLLCVSVPGARACVWMELLSHSTTVGREGPGGVCSVRQIVTLNLLHRDHRVFILLLLLAITRQEGGKVYNFLCVRVCTRCSKREEEEEGINARGSERDRIMYRDISGRGGIYSRVGSLLD